MGVSSVRLPVTSFDSGDHISETVAISPAYVFPVVSDAAKAGGHRGPCARWQLGKHLRDGVQLVLQSLEIRFVALAQVDRLVGPGLDISQEVRWNRSGLQRSNDHPSRSTFTGSIFTARVAGYHVATRPVTTRITALAATIHGLTSS